MIYIKHIKSIIRIESKFEVFRKKFNFLNVFCKIFKN